MKDKSMIFTAILLAISLMNYSMISGQEFRKVEFFSVFAIGMLTGVFLIQFFHKFRSRKRKKGS